MCQFSWIVGDELIHPIGHLFKMRRLVDTDINGFLPKSTTKLRNICDGDVVQRPQHIFIKGRWSFL